MSSSVSQTNLHPMCIDLHQQNEAHPKQRLGHLERNSPSPSSQMRFRWVGWPTPPSRVAIFACDVIADILHSGNARSVNQCGLALADVMKKQTLRFAWSSLGKRPCYVQCTCGGAEQHSSGAPLREIGREGIDLYFRCRELERRSLWILLAARPD